MGNRDDDFDRREFLKRSVTASVAMGSLGLGENAAANLILNETEEQSQQANEIRSTSLLGKTGLEISDISFGSSRMSDPALVRYALDRGITYFDTAESYPMDDPNRAEEAIGEALSGVREKVVIASKVEAEADDRRDQIMRALEGSLRRLRTDHIDVYFNHAVNNLKRLKNPEWFEFAQLAKKQGKIRFTGMSGHGGHLIDCLDVALDENLVDVILVAHNFGQDPAFYEKFTRIFDFVANQSGLPRVLEKAHEQGVGVIAMKTLMGARLNDMRPYEWTGSTFAQAAFRWVLSSPNVDALVVSMTSEAEIDEYLGASGRGVARRSDLRLLRHYAELQTASYCRHGCNACEASCPEDVEISEVLRTRMYATDYGDVGMARASYEKLTGGAAACQECEEQPCCNACPAGLPVSSLTRSTPGIVGAQTVG